jgi:hypothetical protein
MLCAGNLSFGICNVIPSLRLFCFQFFPKYYVLTVHKLDGLFQNNKRFTEVELTATYASIYVTLKSKRVTVNVLF